MALGREGSQCCLAIMVHLLGQALKGVEMAFGSNELV